MRILLVEDDKELCGTIKLQLEQDGYEPTAADRGRRHSIMRLNIPMTSLY